jgi:hypothetical protein
MPNKTLNPSDVVMLMWTRWRPRPGQEPEEAAEAVVSAGYRFAFDSLGGPPSAFFLLKTPGDPASEDASRGVEEAHWEAAMRKLESRAQPSGTHFEFRYLPLLGKRHCD